MIAYLAQRGRPMNPVMLERHDVWWPGAIRAVLALLIVAMLIAGAVMITRMIVNRAGIPQQPPASARGPSSEAMRILEERFARGEIDEAEFRARRDALRA